MPRRLLVVIAVLVLAAVGYRVAAWSTVPPAVRPPVAAIDWGALPQATISADTKRRELTIELPPVDLPGGAGHALEPPTAAGEFPVSGSAYGFYTEAVDADGRVLPGALIHHFNVMDPADRELFLPISRRLVASGGEMGIVRLPWLLFGARIHAGQRVLVNAMLHNPANVSYRGVRVRMVVSYVPDGRPWPLVNAYPWQLDVAFPVCDKSFDLPPGRSERSYEASPGVAGDLLMIGGHLHEYGQLIEMSDATTGELIWKAEPPVTPDGKPGPLPIGKLFGLSRIGVHITPDHRYRVRVVYDNPTGHTLQGGGMGVVGGLFVPDRGAVWPSADTNDALYQHDLRHYLLVPGVCAGASMHMH
jgi:hypothetical protein